MNVLHAAITVVADGIQAEVTLHFLIPQCRNVLHLDLAFNQGFLDLITQDYVRRVAHLVSIYADQAGFYTLIQTDKVSFFQRRLLAKLLGHQRAQDLQEVAAARQLHFKQQALRFVDGR
ncbi:hypothetical protein D3C71_1634160 [compost metagenome]